MSKTILITGASSGIGKLTAIFFAEKGWNVSATMRNTTKGEALLKYPNLKLFTLDVTNEASINQAIEDSVALFGTIDVVLNNAGYGLIGAFEAMSMEQIKKQFDTNFFGTLNVTKAILPHFRAKKSGIIINTSSVGGLVTMPLFHVYGGTKWALEGFMEGLQFELKQFNIKVKTIQPGVTQSEFENSTEFVSIKAYDNYTSQVHKNILVNQKNAPSGEIVARKIWAAANDNSYRLRYAVDRQGKVMLFMRWLLPLSWFNKTLSSFIEKGFKQ